MGASVLAGGLLIAVLVALAALTRRDLREWAAFKAAETTAERQRFYVKWTAVGFAFMCGTSVLALAVLGRVNALWRFPAELEPASDIVERIIGSAGGASVTSGLLPGLVVGGVVGILGAIVIAYARRTDASRPVVIGDIQALIPKNGAEIVRAFPLALNAGLSEEIFFRLLLPLLVTHVTGLPLLACALSAGIFGLAHIYQGWAGVAATTAFGIVMTGVYLATGSLWLPIALHAGMDCVHLVLRPALTLATSSPRGS